MNNHVIICQNNNMIIFFIILILINKKVKFNIDVSIIGFEYNFCINVNYFFDVITLYKEDIIRYKEQLQKEEKKKNVIQNYNWILKYINVDRTILEIKMGLQDVFLTSMAIPVISLILAIVFEKYLSQASKTFSIKPVYNDLFFSLKNSTYISIKLKDIVYIIFRVIREKKKLQK